MRKVKSKWFRMLVESYEVYGGRAYEYVEGVKVCSRKEDRSMRQVVKGVIGGG